MIDRELAGSLARVALRNVAIEYPYKLDQVLGGAADVRPPRELHPVFHGSYDWHSCVHMHWTLARLLRLHPDHLHASDTRVHFARRLTAANVDGELATLNGLHRATFERPYGWGWMLKLAAELELLAARESNAAPWRDAVAPLAQAFADRLVDFLPRAAYPNRAGTHTNSAFALLLALDYCASSQHRMLQHVVTERANVWFGRDRRYPATYEPSGEDFLSAGLVEAALMRRVFDGCSFADWWLQFRPDDDALRVWLQPVTVTDAGNARIVHLHGLNLSRAWCWERLLPELDPRLQQAAKSAIELHLAASLPATIDGDYVGTHWLASFALLALTET